MRRLGLVRSQRLLRQGDEAPIDARAKYVTGLDVQVGRAAIDSRLDDLFHGVDCPMSAASSKGAPSATGTTIAPCGRQSDRFALARDR